MYIERFTFLLQKEWFYSDEVRKWGIKKGIISREAASFPVIGIYHALPIIQLFYKKATGLSTEYLLLGRGFNTMIPRIFPYWLGWEAVPGKRKRRS